MQPSQKTYIRSPLLVHGNNNINNRLTILIIVRCRCHTKKEKETNYHPQTMMIKPATFLFVCAALLLTTFASAVRAAGVVAGAGASQLVGGVPGGLRATNAAAAVVVTTENNNVGRRKLKGTMWNWCRAECSNYSHINHCLADNPRTCLPYVTWFKKAYKIQ
jgi:hypothetical protein